MSSSNIWLGDGYIYADTTRPAVLQSDAYSELSYIDNVLNSGSYIGIDINGLYVSVGADDYQLDFTNDGNLTIPSVGRLLGTASWAENAISASYAPSSPSVSASYAETSSYALVAQSVLGSITSASFATTSSYANNADLLDGLNSTVFATTGSNRFNGNQTITGSLILSSSAVVELIVVGNTELTGSLQVTSGITGSLQGTSSWATTALTASSFTGYLTFPNGLDVTGSTVLTGSGYVLQVLGSASIANNLLVNGGSLFVDAGNNRVAIGTTGSISNTLHVQGTVSASSYTSSINNAVGFLGTASWATNATTASLSTTASLALAVSGSGSRVLYNSANNVTTTSANLIFDGTNLTVGGQLNASTKSFVIDHKQLPGKKLVYGVVEGPEHSVMVRGRISGNNKIHLPEEWEWLVDMNTVTVQLTSIGTFQQLYVDSIDGLIITVRSAGQWNEDIDCFYLVQATRKDVEPLETVV
jgi:hypothetical protein